MFIYFIRHSESQKTEQDRHGGIGLPLTEIGRKNTIDIIDFLESYENLDFGNCSFFCSNIIQVEETARIFENTKHIKFVITDKVKNISIGILDGLSKEEAKIKYPIISENLEKWRKKEIEIDSFTIPEAETMNEFYDRIFEFIQSLVKNNQDTIIIGTRSVGVAITNISHSFKKKLEPKNYKRFLFDTSSISKFEYNNGIPKVIYLNKTDFIKKKSQYTDE